MDLTGAAWRKSSRSGSNGCVEVAFVGDQVAIRDSKHRTGPVLVFSSTEFQALLAGIGHGEFDMRPGRARPRPTDPEVSPAAGHTGTLRVAV